MQCGLISAELEAQRAQGAWLSPEIVFEGDPLKLSFRRRRVNDVWALGRVLMTANHTEDRTAAQDLWQLGKRMSHPHVRDRITLEMPLGMARQIETSFSPALHQRLAVPMLE